jgi:pimeloyl-ACP methyl ester carboxylesterase
MPLIIFSHGNSFPASTYNVLTASLKKRGFTVKSIDKFGHDPKYPVTNNWPHLVEQLAHFAERETEKAGEKAFLVGHSLGGILSTMTAALHPQLARGVVLLDSPIIGGWRAKALQAAKVSGIVGKVSPAAVSHRRTQSWPSVDAAFENFKSKRAFQNWDERCLRDYVDHFEPRDDGKVHLAFDRRIETQIYNSLPDHLESLLRKHPLQCPAAFIGGLQSEELKQTGTELTQRFTQGRMHWIDGTHLFPMEKPVAVAALVEGLIWAIESATD